MASCCDSGWCELMIRCHTQVVLKSQILAGGRGLGKFTSGLQGGVHMVTVDKAPALAKQMLGSVLVTKQTGPAGKPVNTLYVAQKMKLVSFSFSLFRTFPASELAYAYAGSTIDGLSTVFQSFCPALTEWTSDLVWLHWCVLQQKDTNCHNNH